MIPRFLAAAGGGLPPQLLLFAVVFLAWIFKAIQRAVAGPAAQNRPGARPGGPAAVEDEGERERRVREEILRKVTERQVGRRAAPVPSRAAASAAAAPRASAPASLKAQPPAQAPAVAAAPQAPSRGSHWLDELRSRDGVRGAVLAREILGPPLALRPWRYSPLGE